MGEGNEVKEVKEWMWTEKSRMCDWGSELVWWCFWMYLVCFEWQRRGCWMKGLNRRKEQWCKDVWLMKDLICEWKESTMLWMRTRERERKWDLWWWKGRKDGFDKARKHGANVLVCFYFYFWGLWKSWLVVHLLGIWNSTCALLSNTSPLPIINAIIFYTLPFAIIFHNTYI